MRIRKQRQKVPDHEDIDMNKIPKDDTPRYTTRRDLKDALQARQLAIESERKLKENRRLQVEKAKRLQTEKDIKEKEAKRLALEKAQIEALIKKHKPRTSKTPDEVNTPGTGNNANINGKEGTKKGKPPYKKATKASQIKMSQSKGDKPNKDKLDTLLGDPIVNTKRIQIRPKLQGKKIPLV